MALRHVILGLVAEEPLSGYDIGKRLQQTMPSAWAARHSQIYPELAKLLAGGLVEHSEVGSRRRKTYTATEAGREEVVRWLRLKDGDVAAGLREGTRTVGNEVVLRSFFLWLLEPAEAQAYLAKEAGVHRARARSFEALVVGDDEGSGTLRAAVEWGRRRDDALADWAEWAQERLAQPVVGATPTRRRRR